MALAIGTKTIDLTTPASTSRTFSHNQTAGSDRYLFLLVAMSDTCTITGITYAGVAMTPVSQQTTATTLTRWEFWKLAAPATGINNIVITFSVAQFNPVSSFAIAATGCAGSGNTFFDQTAAAPNTGSITVSSNSVVVGALVSGATPGLVIQVNGVTLTNDFSHNINNRHAAGISGTQTSGSKTTSVSSTTNTAGHFMEILEAAGGGGNTQGLLMMF